MFAKKPAVRSLRSTPYNFGGDSSFEMATDLDSTGFLDTTNVSDRRSIQNRRLLKSLQLFNLNMNFWRRSDINANSNAEGGDQPTQVEKGVGCCKILIGVCVFIILVIFMAMALVIMIKVDKVAERLEEKCKMTDCETGNLQGKQGTTPPAKPNASNEEIAKPGARQKNQRQRRH